MAGQPDRLTPRRRWTLGALLVLGLATGALAWGLTRPGPQRVGAALLWLAEDSAGRVYASDAERDLIWIFDSAGRSLGVLRPFAGGAVGTSGPGIQPPGQSRSAPAGGEVESRFCGLAVDSSDHLYIVDLAHNQMQQWDRTGQLRATWPLPPNYVPGPGCVAANDSIYLADGQGLIYRYTAGQPVVVPGPPRVPMRGLGLAADGALLVLHDRNLDRLSPTGDAATTLTLPAPATALRVPYGAVLGRRNGETLVGDITTGRVLRFDAQGAALPPFGGLALLRRVGGLAEDRYGRILVSDPATRTLRRFQANGTPDVVWSTPVEPGE